MTKPIKLQLPTGVVVKLPPIEQISDVHEEPKYETFRYANRVEAESRHVQTKVKVIRLLNEARIHGGGLVSCWEGWLTPRDAAALVAWIRERLDAHHVEQALLSMKETP